MKRNKIIYWITTGLVAAGMLMSAVLYLTGDEQLLQSFKSLGFPLFIVTLLGVAKLLGSVALVSPVPDRMKEWAYAGFAFTFIGAVWTHLATNTSWVAPLLFLFLLSVSYFFRMRLRVQNGNAPGGS